MGQGTARAWAAHQFEVMPLWVAVLASEVCGLTGRTASDVLADTHAAAMTAFALDAVESGRASAEDALKVLREPFGTTGTED